MENSECCADPISRKLGDTDGWQRLVGGNRMSRFGVNCSARPLCPRVFETERGTVVIQGYELDSEARPLPAEPPSGETQAEMPRETFLALARWVQSHGDQVPTLMDLFDGWQHSLFRLEAQQQYLVEGEEGRFAAFRDRKPMPPDLAEDLEWYSY